MQEITFDGSVPAFRTRYFEPEQPAVLPPKTFTTVPASSCWFVRAIGTGASTLNYDYLFQFGDTLVPLELTQPPSADQASDESFHRFHAPFSIFLDWTRSEQTRLFRLYLAQCQLSDLPQPLRDDLPTPDLVLKTGRGDVYDANLWLGLPPTYTPLHRDPNPNLFVQLAGKKHVRLMSPEAGMRIFSEVKTALGQHADRGAAVFRGEEMMQGMEKVLLEEAIWGETKPERQDETGFEAVLDAGDGIFIPKGWWHSIKGVGEGVTASVNWWFR
ncbi:hypothetical protein VTN31DRAFT_855 [Thermomyces dupontii]|uniref:uncharacterized protein n=1 Tax=Talaromyces thermophilus TaxID=28565 RepID=UPI003741FEDE